MRVEILPIFTNLYQEVPDSHTQETYPVYIWLDLRHREAWAEADQEMSAYISPKIYAWKIPLMSDANTMELMQGLRDKFVCMIENHIEESPLPPYTEGNHCQWTLNDAGAQAKYDINRYLEQFCSSITE